MTVNAASWQTLAVIKGETKHAPKPKRNKCDGASTRPTATAVVVERRLTVWYRATAVENSTRRQVDEDDGGRPRVTVGVGGYLV